MGMKIWVLLLHLLKLADTQWKQDPNDLERFGSKFPRSCAKYVMTGKKGGTWTTYVQVENEGWEKAAYKACSVQGGTACAYRNEASGTDRGVYCFPQQGESQCCVVDVDVDSKSPSKPPVPPTNIYGICGGVAPGDYSKNGTSGPGNWSAAFPKGDCGKPNQSPINIKTSAVTEVTSGATISLQGIKNGFEGQFCDNGHILKLLLKDPRAFTYQGSHFSEGQAYGLWQIEWKYSQTGHPLSHGSEHAIDGEHTDMEMQMVFYDRRNRNLGAAMNKYHQVSMLSILYRESDTDNPLLNELVTALQSVKLNNKQNYNIGKLFDPMMFGQANASYYYYEGSMTEPPSCKAGIVWTVMEEIQNISKTQLAVFRKLKGQTGKPLGGNIRPIQKNSNEVKHVAPVIETTTMEPGTGATEATSGTGETGGTATTDKTANTEQTGTTGNTGTTETTGGT